MAKSDILWSAAALTEFSLAATDGDIGGVSDLYFDDAGWRVRYGVIDTGGWLPGRKVLISPDAFGDPDPNSRTIPVALTKQQVKDSPHIDTDKPVSRQEEVSLAEYFGWPDYWVTGVAAVPVAVEAAEPGTDMAVPRGDPHLRSMADVRGFDIVATDDSIGHVEDFLVGGAHWSVRYIVIDTRNWLPGGKKVLCDPDWVLDVGWSERHVRLDVPKDKVENSPELAADGQVDRAYEERLYRHYDRRPYWPTS